MDRAAASRSGLFYFEARRRLSCSSQVSSQVSAASGALAGHRRKRAGSTGNRKGSMKSGIALRVVWLVLSVATLIYCQHAYDGTPNSDAEQVLIILMFILSFPASFIAGGIVVAAAFGEERVMHSSMHVSRIEMLLVWFLFLVVGYIQWFILIPHAWSKWRSSHAERTGRSWPPEY
jgi:hypothetical protein